MSKEYFNKEKQDYENIEIPRDLDFIVRKTLKKGRSRKRNKVILNISTVASGVAIVFILAVNLFPKVAYAASLIPGVNKLVELVTWDKGFDNAVDEGLTQEINFEEEKEGITLKVESLAGDWKKLWINYSIEDGSENINDSNGMPKYNAEINVKLPEKDKEIGCYYGTGSLNENGEGIMDIGFPEFIESFTLEFKIYKNSGEVIKIGEEVPTSNYLAVFEIPITLDESIFNSKLNTVNINNKIIETEVGNILIDSIKSSKTRIVMTFNLESEIYDYMGFENPMLVDDKGNEYKMSDSYISSDLNNKTVEFSGEIKEGVKSLEFKCDGVYYARKDNREIVINLKEKLVEPNGYGFTFALDNKGEVISGNQIIIKSKEVKGASFSLISNDSGEEVLKEQGQSFYGSDEEGYTTQIYFKVLNSNVEKLILKLDWVRKDITEAVSSKLLIKDSI